MLVSLLQWFSVIWISDFAVNPAFKSVQSEDNITTVSSSFAFLIFLFLANWFKRFQQSSVIFIGYLFSMPDVQPVYSWDLQPFIHISLARKILRKIISLLRHTSIKCLVEKWNSVGLSSRQLTIIRVHSAYRKFLFSFVFSSEWNKWLTDVNNKLCSDWLVTRLSVHLYDWKTVWLLKNASFTRLEKLTKK